MSDLSHLVGQMLTFTWMDASETPSEMKTDTFKVKSIRNNTHIQIKDHGGAEDAMPLAGYRRGVISIYQGEHLLYFNPVVEEIYAKGEPTTDQHAEIRSHGEWKI